MAGVIKIHTDTAVGRVVRGLVVIVERDALADLDSPRDALSLRATVAIVHR